MYSIEYLLVLKKGIDSSMPAEAADVFGFFAKGSPFLNLDFIKGKIKCLQFL
jgi:hypothetical protein